MADIFMFVCSDDVDGNLGLYLITGRRGGGGVTQGWDKISSHVFLCNRRNVGLLTSQKSKAWHIPLYK